MNTISTLQQLRLTYKPQLPTSLQSTTQLVENNIALPKTDQNELKALFPNTYALPTLSFKAATQSQPNEPAINVGVILSGGQAPGGHNVICGIFDAIKTINQNSKLFGFLGGPGGLIKHKYVELTEKDINAYRNTGGFDIIGSGRTKLETIEQFNEALTILKQLNINAVIIIGGDDSNTNACLLAEYYASINANIHVIGCPKTIDGDLKNEWIPTSFGFDTACKVYAELIGNIQRDCLSAKKYYHFMKVMGRSASHIALECALQTHPNLCLISEEVAAKQQTLEQIINQIVQVIVERAEKGYNFGTVIVPEGLIEFLPDVKQLINELNELLATNTHTEQEFKAQTSAASQRAFVIQKLQPSTSKLFESLPENIAAQLTLDRDPHGNVQVSRIETEKLLIEMVQTQLQKLHQEGSYNGTFTAINHFFGYEGRCAAPSNFDADYCYALGHTAAQLAKNHKTGYMASIQNAHLPVTNWQPAGIPISAMMNLERRHGKQKPVIQKALVELNGKPFEAFSKLRAEWAINNHYTSPGPIQFFGPSELCNATTITLQLEKSGN